MSSETHTQELIEKARGGERKAFDQLVSAVEAPLLANIHSRIGDRLGAKLDPEDVLQETLVRAFRSVRHFRWQGEESFQRWLEGIASNFILHSARTYARKREIRIRHDPAAADVSPSRNERRHDRFDRLQRSIDDLSPNHRTVIRLARLEGLRIAEIAERMQRSESAVKNLLLRAMRQLKDSFGETESLSLPDRFLKEESCDGE